MSTKTSPGETSLTTLLATLNPILHPDTFVFLTFPPASTIPASLTQQMMFREAEGVTVITTLDSAAGHSGLKHEFPCRMITLDVHSSLEAVGFLAAVTARLKGRGIGVNPVSGYYHDHLFIPVGREGEAMEELRALARESS